MNRPRTRCSKRSKPGFTPLAGVPVNRGALFLFGDRKTEYVWCRWARHHADSELLESLLSIATIDQWPIEAAEKAEWSSFALERGRFSINFEPNSTAFSLPRLDRVLSACLVIQAQGRLGWMTGNRILLRRVGDHGSAGLLAILIALGALKANAADWQMPHAPGPALDKLLARLSAQLHCQGELSWNSQLGKTLAAEALGADVSQLGWVSRHFISEMFVSFDSLEKKVDEPLDPLDRLLGEHKESVRSASFDTALRALCEDDRASNRGIR